ncbi:polysaccharide pyruvyl transferase family protein [Enterococcus wangshanyuanii]|uniref:Polysaccharide pyruvyl transferase domain-containing protein n=1 Tax=Enterococcus wangshanyuanii TaxID=2005703 RepID=A0ABQ1PQU1_9ENTE|nr:polysaccharide pyruvyl transferase family protein [Enterococcus wangshanyuanii]GGD01186.1 hypothetical protein GCM10011573_33430 [Enterococcus wangshanyuanii]
MEKYMVSGYWKNNLGDDLFLKILCEKFPDSIFYTFIDKEYMPVFSGVKNLRLISNSNFMIKVANKILTNLGLPLISDFYTAFLFKQYIEIGGSIFMQDVNWQKKIRRRTFINDHMQDYYVIGSNFGPYSSTFFLDSYRNLFNSIKTISFRDQYSKQLFPEIKEINVSPDAILSLRTNSSIEMINEDEEYILISVINLSTNKANRSERLKLKVNEYEKKMSEIIQRYIEMKKHVVLMSFCNFEEDDLAIERIKKQLPQSVAERVTVFHHRKIDESLEVIGRAKKIVATRFHGMVLGWLYRIPTFVVSYSKKTEIVISELNKEQEYCDIDSFSSLTFEEIEQRFTTISKERLSKLSESSSDQFKFVSEHEGMVTKNGE